MPLLLLPYESSNTGYQILDVVEKPNKKLNIENKSNTKAQNNYYKNTK